MVNIIWVISYLSDKHKKSNKYLLDSGILPKILNLIIHYSDVHIIMPTLRMLGNLVSGTAKTTQAVVESGALDKFKLILNHPNRGVRKEICWIISNIAAGTQLQIEELIVSGYLPILDNIIRNDEPEIIKEAVWAICNFTSTDKKELAEILFKQNILDLNCYLLKLFKESKYIAVCLEALGNLLEFGKKYFVNETGNPVVNELIKKGMCDYLEELQLNPNELIYEKALKLIENYFETDDS